MKTKEALGVIWLVKQSGEANSLKPFHEEADGFTAHSLWKEQPNESIIGHVCGDIRERWANYSQVRSSAVFAEEYNDLCFDFRISEWPSQPKWFSLLEETLGLICKKGAAVAWIDVSNSSFSWPGLFDTTYGSESVYAAYSQQTGLLVHSAPDEEMRFLENAELQELRGVLSEANLS